ncbi:MAG: antibiotic biosynthesis monooxygenase [Ignavibacteriae bacterium]|nr:antibiotic biosynthesis monooxygenase [Ignavibacteria bacterium]MBI3365797.1 antibiotic biosynthesis monooxygenase [Ignavibacteriota bacterium]
MYIIVWEFWPRKGKEEEFKRVYSATGEWVEFFKRGEGYVDTTLCADAGSEGRYLTIDRWVSKEAYDMFRRTNREEYESIDKRCEGLTARETLIGYFNG